MTKPDGSSWVNEFMKLAEDAIPRPGRTDEIVDMILEEVEPFYLGVKDAATVAECIQNRVELYLAENSNFRETIWK